jgi:hypothetical protein
MRIERTYVTPTMADEWLSKRWEKQRPLREGHVQRLIADLTVGRYHFGPQTIVFDQRGRLVDGQHRLEACRRCGVSFETLVAWEVDEAVVPKLGQAEGWSLAALLNLHTEARQFGAQHNVATASSVGSFLFKQLTGKRRRPTDDEAVAVIVHFRDSILWSLEACSVKALSKVAVRSAFVVMHSSRPGSFEMFAEKVRTGVGLTRNDPALTLRDYLISESSTFRTENVDWQFYKVLRAGEAYVNNEKLFKLSPAKDTQGAVRDQMDVFLGSSLRLADKLGLLEKATGTEERSHVDGTAQAFPVRDATRH